MLDTLVAAVSPALADAVAIALALDPGERYQTAREMGRALSDGAHGIAPGEHTTGARTAPATQATSVLTGSRRPAGRDPERSPAPSAVTPRRPRSGPPRHQPAALPAPDSVPARSSRRRGSRLLMALLGLLALAGVIVAVVIVTAPASTKVVLRNVVYSDVKQASAALEQLVSENTK
jgi:hypothetical protein